MNKNTSKFATSASSASQQNLKFVSTESGHSFCLELPSKFHFLSHLLVFPRALEELGTHIHYTSRICENVSNSSVQDYRSASGVAQVSSLPLNKSRVCKKKRKEMALLFRFLDLNSCPLLNQNKKFIFSPSLKKTNNIVSLKYFWMIILKHFILVSVFILKRTPKKQKLHYLNYEVGCFWQFQNSSNAGTCWAERFVQFDPVLQTIAVTDASGKNNSLKKFPKPLMYITENRHWSLSYKNLASDLLLLFFRSFSFHNCSVCTKSGCAHPVLPSGNF